MTGRFRPLLQGPILQVVIMMVLVPLASSETGAADLSDLHPGAWGGTLEAGYAFDRERLRSSDGSPETDFTRHLVYERLTVRNQGFYFIDPGLLTGNLGVSFDLVQARESSNRTPDSRNGRLIGYAFDTTIFPDLPYNGTLYANRTQNLLTLPFLRSELAFENRGAVLRLREDSPLRDWGFPYFSANLRAEQQHTQETTTNVFDQSFRRDEWRDLLSLDGHKGFETADLDLRYEFNNLKDQALPQLGFQSQTAALNYSLDFGPTLNRHSDSRLFYYTRNGVSPYTNFTADENVHIDHLENFSTNYRYLLARTDTQAGTTTLQNGAFNLRYDLYRALTIDTRLSAEHQELPTGVRDTKVGQLGIQYQRNIPSNGSVSALVGGRYQVDDNRLDSSQISVNDEAHAAPSPLGAGAGFLLDRPFVVATSIVVVDTRGGARLPTALGMDYVVSQEGNLTRIIPLPVSAVIQAGDPLAVSYIYGVAPGINYSTTSQLANVGLNYPWIALSYGHEQSRQSLLSGEDLGFLQDLRKDTAQLDLRGTWNALDVHAGAGYHSHQNEKIHLEACNE